MVFKPFKGQDYELLKNEHNEESLFEDPEFPPNESSLYYTKRSPPGIVWKRPREVIENPQFVVDGFGRCDMDQGYVGNCWFIAGAVGIMQSEKLFARVVPPDQSFSENYAGIFHFRFWLYGEWIDVVVDDRLPYWQKSGQLVFASNKEQPNEYWAPLLEKAYAKLYRCYENLEAGQTTDALIDMSGGLQESFDLTKMNSNSEYESLWTALYQAFNKNSISGCSITADPRVREAKLPNGLVMGHAYTITKLINFDLNGSENRLIRIRNPWGNNVEWNGSWSDKSKEWNRVDSETREQIGLSIDHDGEFWMSYKDFLSNWHQVQICHLSASSFSDEINDASDIDCLSWRKLAGDTDAWKCTMYHSEWISGKTAGGCGQPNQSKFWTNPQFLLVINDVDKYDNENKASVIISLMQKDSRLKRLQTKSEESAEEYIQFRLYKIKDNVVIDENKSTCLKLYSNQLDRIGTSGSYINSREVTKRFRVEPGNYLIIPSTYEENKNCEFLLRIFTEEEIEANSLEENKEDLTEDEVFFEIDENDEIFNSWGALMGQTATNENDNDNQNQNLKDIKEACRLM